MMYVRIAVLALACFLQCRRKTPKSMRLDEPPQSVVAHVRPRFSAEPQKPPHERQQVGWSPASYRDSAHGYQTMFIKLTQQSSSGMQATVRACRSVHLWYPSPEARVFYNEVIVRKSAEGTYFAVCGWSTGYFGIQELGNGRKIALFSVWDPGKQNDPNAVVEGRRVRVLRQAEDVTVRRFGGEGTGGQCFYQFDWEVGRKYRFAVVSARRDKRTAFSGYIYLDGKKKWKHLVTFSTITKDSGLRGLYSFVEDFRRNGVSATKNRTAEYGIGWVLTSDGQWRPLRKATFTADGTPATNFDGGLRGSRFFLSTGGNISTQHGELNQTYTLGDRIKSPRPDTVLKALVAEIRATAQLPQSDTSQPRSGARN